GRWEVEGGVGENKGNSGEIRAGVPYKKLVAAPDGQPVGCLAQPHLLTTTQRSPPSSRAPAGRWRTTSFGSMKPCRTTVVRPDSLIIAGREPRSRTKDPEPGEFREGTQEPRPCQAVDRQGGPHQGRSLALPSRTRKLRCRTRLARARSQ